MNIVIPESVIKWASEASPGRGSRKMEILTEYAAESVPDGERITDWDRNADGELIAVTAAIPDEE